MPATATLERGATSVTIPLLVESGGTPITSDVGKPNLSLWESGVLNPRFNDQWSGLEQISIQGQYLSDADYSTAIDLADLVKSCSGGDPLTLSTTLPTWPDEMEVAPAAQQDAALSLSYNSGERGIVTVSLSLTRVSNTQGSVAQQATTPAASGTGPIQLSGGTTTIDLTTDVSVTRSVGRPNSVVKRSMDAYPRYIDKPKAATDTFELSAVYTDNNVTQLLDAKDLIAQRLGRSPLTLDFNGLFGLGAFDVAPDGSQAFRHASPAGFEGVSRVPTIQLRRVKP